MTRLGWAILLAASLLGCEGNPVQAAGSDAAPKDAVDDTGGGATCAPVTPNLVLDGDFSSGLGAWFRQGTVSSEIVPGRCGRSAMRIYGAREYGRLVHDYEGVPLPKGTRLRLRAWFKKGSGPWPGTAPSVFVRSWDADGAESEFGARGVITDDWVESTVDFTLIRDQASFSVYLASLHDANADSDEFQVADVSLKVE